MKKAILGILLLSIVFTSGCTSGGKGASPSNLDTRSAAAAADVNMD